MKVLVPEVRKQRHRDLQGRAAAAAGFRDSARATRASRLASAERRWLLSTDGRLSGRLWRLSAVRPRRHCPQPAGSGTVGQPWQRRRPSATKPELLPAPLTPAWGERHDRDPPSLAVCRRVARCALAAAPACCSCSACSRERSEPAQPRHEHEPGRGPLCAWQRSWTRAVATHPTIRSSIAGNMPISSFTSSAIA